jgi:hypothetical protein
MYRTSIVVDSLVSISILILDTCWDLSVCLYHPHSLSYSPCNVDL